MWMIHKLKITWIILTKTSLNAMIQKLLIKSDNLLSAYETGKIPWSQRTPVQPSAHIHWNEPRVFSHLAPFKQGPRLHSLSSILHVGPVQPSEQSQMNPPGIFLHVAPWLQGLLKHSSVSGNHIWHFQSNHTTSAFLGVNKVVVLSAILWLLKITVFEIFI